MLSGRRGRTFNFEKFSLTHGGSFDRAAPVAVDRGGKESATAHEGFREKTSKGGRETIDEGGSPHGDYGGQDCLEEEDEESDEECGGMGEGPGRRQLRPGPPGVRE